jgi:uncharacterized protein YjbI with pentapeptide repeats
VLLLLAVAAGIAGALALIANPSAGGLGMGALLVALIGAPFLIWSTAIRQTTLDYQREGHITDRISKAVEQLGAEKTVKLAGPDGQTVERSEPNIEVRIGGILALERIAQDSTRLDQGRDHVRVMEILCAYIRENAPASTARNFPLPDWVPLKDDATEAERQAHKKKRELRFGGLAKDQLAAQAMQWALSLTAPRADVALALTVIGRRSALQRRVEAAWPNSLSENTKGAFEKEYPDPPEAKPDSPITKTDLDKFKDKQTRWWSHVNRNSGYRLDLRFTNLQGADLSKGVFSGARFVGSRFQKADFRNSRLEGADFNIACLEGAIMGHSRLQGAYLGNARMEGADLRRSRLDGAFLSHARLDGAMLNGASLCTAYLFEARISGASVLGANLAGAELRKAYIDGSVLPFARLDLADLSEAVLSETFLGGAQLGGARFNSARIESLNFAAIGTDRAHFERTSVRAVKGLTHGMEADQIAKIFADGSVALPGIEPGGEGWPAHWPVRALDWAEFEHEWRRWQADPEGYVPPP